jgi:hypothetical protein
VQVMTTRPGGKGWENPGKIMGKCGEKPWKPQSCWSFLCNELCWSFVVSFFIPQTDGKWGSFMVVLYRWSIKWPNIEWQLGEGWAWVCVVLFSNEDVQSPMEIQLVIARSLYTGPAAWADDANLPLKKSRNCGDLQSCFDMFWLFCELETGQILSRWQKLMWFANFQSFAPDRLVPSLRVCSCTHTDVARWRRIMATHGTS